MKYSNIICVIWLCLLYPYNAKAQNIVLTLDQVVSLSDGANESEILKSDSLITQYNNKLFNIKVLPKLNLTATLLDLNNSISPVTLSDGTEKYVDRFYSTTNFGISISQLIPFTGGTLSLSSTLNRLGNYKPGKMKSYNMTLVNFSYNQKISGYNQYKWEKRIRLIQREINNIKHVQQKEIIKEKAIELFFDLYQEQRKLELNQYILSFAKFVYERSKKLYEEKKILEIDFIESEIEYRKAQNNNNQLDIIQAQQNLKNYLSLKSDEDLYVVFLPSIINQYHFDFISQNVVDRAIEFTTDVTRKYDKIQNEQKLKQISQEYNPSITLSVGGGINSQSDDFASIVNAKSKRINVMLSFSIPILNWGANKTNKLILKENIRKSDLNYERDKLENSTKYYHDLSYVHVLRSNIMEDVKLNGLYLRNIDVLKTNAQYGKIDMTKIIQAQRQLVQNEIKYISNIKYLYSLIYKFRAISLIDIRDNSHVVEFVK